MPRVNRAKVGAKLLLVLNKNFIGVLVEGFSLGRKSAVDQQAETIVIGDVRDVADGIDCGPVQNGRMSRWNHGKIRQHVTYKAEAEGMAVVLVDEHDTSKTCPNPNCTQRHKPAGRIYRCPVCGFQAHRDVVGAVNILSRQVLGDVGKIRPPPTTMYRHPFLTGKRSGPDTGQPATVVACGTGCQPQEAVSL